MKCKIKGCRCHAKKGHLKCSKHIMREWRENHPVMDAWNNHRFNAKKRGIAVEWTLEEFKLFCDVTGYHILRKNGLTIDRENCLLGYNLKNCQTLSHYDNSVKGSRIERWIKQKKSQ